MPRVGQEGTPFRFLLTSGWGRPSVPGPRHLLLFWLLLGFDYFEIAFDW